jgi:hypothetical protein
MALVHLLAAVFYTVGSVYYAVALWLLIKRSREHE